MSSEWGCIRSFDKQHPNPTIQALNTKLKWRLSHHPDYHRLAAAEAWVAFRAAVIGESSEAYSVTLTPIREEVRICSMYAVNRGFNAIIEAAVHGTRYLMNHDPDLKWLIDHHLALARKCGGKQEKEAARMVEYKMEKERMGFKRFAQGVFVLFHPGTRQQE